MPAAVPTLSHPVRSLTVPCDRPTDLNCSLRWQLAGPNAALYQMLDHRVSTERLIGAGPEGARSALAAR